MRKVLLAIISFFLCFTGFAQQPQEWSSDEIYQGLQKLNVLVSVLYVGAHPDDENTQIISYFSNKTHARTAYLSMTRGDGGQNLIGPEIREALGVIRTQELLAARKIDGGQQFFTRANDFGYSKTPQETFSIWDKEKVLSDVVRVFRKFKPDVVIDRFNHRTEGDTHGHHTASARLSVKAFNEANNKNKYPDQIDLLGAWQPEKLYFNTSYWFYGSREAFEQADKKDFAEINVGNYFPLQGISNTEIAALSRSQHKSQGFGNTAERKNEIEYLEPIKGDFKQQPKDIFAGIDTSWARLKNGGTIGKKLKKIITNYDFKAPSKSLSEMLAVYQMIEDLKPGHWRKIKLKEAEKLIAAMSGLYLQAATTQEFATPGKSFDLQLEATNRSDFKVDLKSVGYENFEGQSISAHELQKNSPFYRAFQAQLPLNVDFSTPYWLMQKAGKGMYKVKRKKLIGLPQTPDPVKVRFNLSLNGVPVSFERSIIYKTNDRVQGEVFKPFNIIPKVSVNLKNENLIFSDGLPKTIEVEVTSHSKNVNGKLKLKHPDNWKVSPKSIDLTLNEKQSKTLNFEINPPKNSKVAHLKPVFETSSGKTYSKKLQIINYNHIPQQAIVLPSEAKLIRLDIKKKDDKIGYIKGAGDVVAENLRILGYQVDVFEASEISTEKLNDFDAIVVGVRAYNKSQALVNKNSVLLDYVKTGGTLVTQYNTTGGLKLKNPSPFELHISHNRVTDENSPVTFLDKDHPALNSPNKITTKDFEGWVQERGLYFPDEWGPQFTPILSLKDPGEKPKEGSLLIAKYGKGHYVYTGLSFFREFPAGVPGAYRLFANLLSLGN
jgi:LmbE family N-acetylglucosaminyl deacetylase